MMKLLVCDDDISTIDVIQSQLDCRELGISTILRAYNGEMAEQIVDEEHPDIILCDIDMPIHNGIDVMKYVYEKAPGTEFSFLTCYEKFEYAQMAVNYGVTSYLTKPFDLEDVKICIQKMAANVIKKRMAIDINPQSQYDSLMSSIFRQASDGILGSTKELVSAGLRMNGVSFGADSIWRIIFTCADMTDAIRKTWSKDLLLFTTSRMHDEALLNYIGSAHTVVNSDDRFIWSLCFIEGNPGDDELLAKSRTLIDFSDMHMSLRPAVLISEPFMFYQASSVVCELYDRMRKMRYYGGNIFLMSQDNLPEVSNGGRPSENQVLWYLKKRDEAGYTEYLDSLLDGMRCTVENLNVFRRELIHIFITHFRDNGLSTNSIFLDQRINSLDDLACNSREAMMDYAVALFRFQQEMVRDSVDSEDIIERAKKYILDNYRENIDRNDVAAVTFVTPNYLSKLFKNNMNMNLREYINQLRIEEAKRLLLSTEMSVSEIASYVGYYNISYFSTVFHKIVGVSPFTWRNQAEE